MKVLTRALFYIGRFVMDLCVLLAILYGAYIIADYIESRNKRTLYVSVKAPERWLSGATFYMDFEGVEPPAYLIDSGDLYLLKQIIGAVECDACDWDSKKLQELMKKEELRKYFPDPSAPDGGVAWLPFPGEAKKQ